MQVNLTQMEIDLLLVLVQEQVASLKSEIRRSDTPKFRDELKRRRDEIRNLARKLESTMHEFAEVG